MTVPVQTLLYAFREDQQARREVLLGRKLRGFGQGLIMAPGGHVEPGESVESAAVREAHEEAGSVVHAFCARRWSGQVAPSDE